MTSTFYAPNDYRHYIEHFGVKGMKWGVRRYRDYDGSYTQAGLRRYGVTERRYEDADASLKKAKADYKAGTGSKLDVNRAKNTRKEALRDLKKDYKRLKNDKLADEGKRMYAEGKTITGNWLGTQRAASAVALTSVLLDMYGKREAAIATMVGGSAVIAGKRLVNEHGNKRLRAYYGHGANWAGWDSKNAKYKKQYGY